MDFEKRLKYLDVMYQSKELQYYLDTKKEIDYYSLFYVELKVLLDSIFRRGNASKDNIRTFIDNLDIILKYTNGSNMDWIYFECLYNEVDFIDKLVQCLPKMRFQHHICFLVARICNVIGKDKEKELLNNEFLSKLLALPIPYQLKTYGLIFDRLDSQGRFDFFKKVLEYNKIIDFSRMGIEALSNDIISFIGEHVIEFALNSIDIFALRELLSSNSDAIRRLNDYFNIHKYDMAKLITQSMRLYGYSDDIKEIMTLIILDVIKNENAILNDISWRFGGSYSDLLIIKDKVIKYGESRSTKSFPNNPYIVKPLLRKSFCDNEKQLFVEVVECELPEEVTEDQMYELYKNFRDLDLIWQDVKKDNVGFLKKDNTIHWNGNLSPSDEALGLEPFRGENKILKAGSVVLLDADSIYDLRDEEVSHNKSKYLDQVFEKKYLNELKKVKKL